ncbi:hypothetical protein PPERSA_00594 [Pseudocohnilembus persalinus]|uniref:Uncharacterized protein n=1 Tax=Pseudocohnilembus persalinus TaxID=266149 RepID=A0A0V0QSY2_PSEPJ|nr:hypothetical protein PPERSA_00594 [Pseudocohnilembus persalinus]|eukprot:KRX05293.1 hypothetical protein PPERSA_00594 [Pseudocohnilembus persalinus]
MNDLNLLQAQLTLIQKQFLQRQMQQLQQQQQQQENLVQNYSQQNQYQQFSINNQGMQQQQQQKQQYQQMFLEQQFGKENGLKNYNENGNNTNNNHVFGNGSEKGKGKFFLKDNLQDQKESEQDFENKIQKKIRVNPTLEKYISNQASEGTLDRIPLLMQENSMISTNQQIESLEQQQQQQKQIQHIKLENLEKKNIIIKCHFHPDQNITQICTNKYCMKQKLSCPICAEQFHSEHELQELQDYAEQLPRIIDQIQLNSQDEEKCWGKIQKLIDVNNKYLKDVENLTSKLQKGVFKLQSTLKIIQEKQLGEHKELKKKIELLQERYQNPEGHDLQNQVQEMTKIIHQVNKYEYNSISSYPQIIDIVELNEQLNGYSDQYLRDFAFYIVKIGEKQDLLERKFDNIDYKSLIEPQKESSNSKKVVKLTQVFHQIKGKAKKRDIINFVQWNEQKQEIKFVKDIKEKEEKSHYQLVFVCYIKNLESLEIDQIDEDLMAWIRKQVFDIYPQVKREKEEQRKMGNIKPSNKRRYCKLDFKFDIDVKNYLYSNSPIDTQSDFCI